MDAYNLQEIMNEAKSGDLTDAEEKCQKLLNRFPDDEQILHACSVIALQLKNPEKAVAYITRAITLQPSNAFYYYQAGLVYSSLQQTELAITHYQTALELQPSLQHANIQLGNIFAKENNLITAEQHYRTAIAQGNVSSQVYNNFANTLVGQGKIDEAIICYKKVLSDNSKYIQANFNLANALYKKNQFEEALHYFFQTLHYDPKHLEARYNVARTLTKLGKNTEAITYLQSSLKDYQSPKFFIFLGNLFLKFGDYKKAIATFEQGLNFFATDIELLGILLMSSKKICAWKNLNKLQELLLNAVKEIIQKDLTFSLLNYQWLGLDFSGEEQLLLAKKIAKYHFSSLIPIRKKLDFQFTPKPKVKLKIGYVSGDIRDHATSHLIKNMFAFHDRNRFEIYLYSIGPKDLSNYRQHIATQCDYFVDLFENSVSECAQKIYNDGIDILIDMMGYTEFSKMGIFALKPAPIQISYLGYPGTTGLDTMDYLVVDQNLFLPDWANFTSEKLIFLPDTLFITDHIQEIAPLKLSREDYGLPLEAVIFCSFNNLYKIQPNVFISWMKILKEVPNSVLWLYSDNELAVTNLKNEAQMHQIEPNRLVFAPKLLKKEHLARLQLADICLDCFTINAGTTAIDALWAGVPFIGYENPIRPRVPRSILCALGLPELVATNPQSYEALAIHYATHSEHRNTLREKIRSNKTKYPLFQTKRYVKNLEKGFEKVWQHYLLNRSDDIFVD